MLKKQTWILLLFYDGFFELCMANTESLKNIMIIKKRQCLLVFQNYPTKMAGIIFLWFFLYSSAFDFESPLWVWADVQLGPFDLSVGALLKDE